MPCVAEVVNRSLKADCTDFTSSLLTYVQAGSSLKHPSSSDHELSETLSVSISHLELPPLPTVSEPLPNLPAVFSYELSLLI